MNEAEDIRDEGAMGDYWPRMIHGENSRLTGDGES